MTSRVASAVLAALVAALVTVAAPVAIPPAAAQSITTVAPGRILDTRPTGVTVDGVQQAGGLFAAGETRTVPVAGRANVPANGVTAVAVNITAINPSATSFVTAFPTGSSRPNASNLNLAAGRTLPNMAIVPLGTGGAIDLFNNAGTVHLAVDVMGWFGSTGDYTPVAPGRLLDTRPTGVTVDGEQEAGGTFGAGETRTLPIAGRGGVPLSGVAAVAVNITAVNPSATSFMTVFPSGTTRPTTSNLNLSAGQTVPNMAIVTLGAGGAIDLFNNAGTVHVLVDVMGWFAAGGDYTTVAPGRLLDTRPTGVTVDGAQQAGGTLGAGATRTLPVAGRGGVPASGVAAVAVNITAVNPSATSFVTVFPSGTSRPNASNLNLAAGRNLPNMAIVPLGAGGAIDLFNNAGDTHLLVDVVGWFPPDPAPSTSIVNRRLDDLSHGGVVQDTDVARGGGFVAFTSSAGNLVSGDLNGHTDVFVRNLSTGAIEIVSLADDNTALEADSFDPSISDDGRYVVFLTSAVATSNDANGAIVDVFRRDRQTGTTERVSVRVDGSAFEFDALDADVSGDGNVVAFVAAEQVSAVSQRRSYARTISTGATELISPTVSSFFGGTGPGVSISQDGDKVAFTKRHTNPGSDFSHVFRWDVSSDTFVQMTHFEGTATNDQGGIRPVLSDDGNAVIAHRHNETSLTLTVDGVEQIVETNIAGQLRRTRFAGSSKNVLLESDEPLVAADTNGSLDIYLRTTGASPTYTLLSARDDGANPDVVSNGVSLAPSMSSDQSVLAFASSATNLAVLPAADGTNLLLLKASIWSVGTDVADGTTSHGFSMTPALSADGRYVVYATSATDVFAGEFEANFDVVRLDRASGTTELVSADVEAAATLPDVSDDGNRVVFATTGPIPATGLNMVDTSFRQIFVRDVGAGTTTAVSQKAPGVPGNNINDQPAISGNGRFVVFQSSASDLLAGDTNGRNDVYLRDLQTGTLERVSLDANDGQILNAPNDFLMAPDVSFDGRYVTWFSSAANVVPGVTTTGARIYRRDRVAGTTELVGNGLAPVISDDGRFVAFHSTDSTLVANDTNSQSDVFVKDMVAGTVTRVSVSSAGAQATGGGSDSVQLSGNGRWLTFLSNATNLVPGDTNARNDVFRHDRLTGETVRVSVSTAGAQGTGGSAFSRPSISESGRFVAFDSSADGLAAGDANPPASPIITDVFLRDLG